MLARRANAQSKTIAQHINTIGMPEASGLVLDRTARMRGRGTPDHEFVHVGATLPMPSLLLS